MATVRAEAGGRVVLPEAMAGFFQSGETIEVRQYQDHLELRRVRHRPHRDRPGESAKVTRKNVYLEASKRFAAVVPVIEREHPEVALYVSGYALECRLKYQVCSQWDVDYLADAEEMLQRMEHRELSLTGGGGHDLEVLLRAAHCQALLGADLLGAGQPGMWQLALDWRPDWRYQVPVSVRRQASAYLQAIKSAYQALCEVT